MSRPAPEEAARAPAEAARAPEEAARAPEPAGVTLPNDPPDAGPSLLPISSRTLSWRLILALWVFYLSLMAIGLGADRALTRHEVFAAQPAREMLAYGGSSPRWWLIQHFGELPRYEKPPAMSWLIAGSIGLFGEREWAARLPAVLAGGAVVWMVAVLATRLFGRTTGMVAGAMQATFFYMVMQARLAEVDIVLTAVVFGALLCMAWAWVPGAEPAVDLAAHASNDADAERSRRRALWGWGFAVLTGVSMALKGPVGPMLVFAGVTGFAVTRRLFSRPAVPGGDGIASGSSPPDRRSEGRLRDVLAWAFQPVRLGVLLVVAAAWPLAAAGADAAVADFWQRELLSRLTTGAHIDPAGASSREPWWFYGWNVPMLLLPWVLVVPWAFSAARRRGVAQSATDWSLGVLLGGVVVLSLLADKHKHYIIPVLPAVTPLLAAGLLELLRARHAASPGGYLVLGGGWVLGAVGAAFAVAIGVAPPLRDAVLLAVLALAVGGLFVLLAERRRWFGGQLLALFATAYLTIAVVNGLVTPAAERFGVFREFARQARTHLRPGERLELVGLGMHPVAFYLPLPFGRIDRPDDTWFPGVGRRLVLSAAGLQRWRPVWAERGVGTEILVEGEPMRRGGDREGERLVLVRTYAKPG